MTSTLIWIAVALLAIGVYLSWTAGRLDRLHARIDAARAALDAQLLRRASVAQELATAGVLDPAASIVLYEAAHAARQADEEAREVAESELSQALRAVFGDASQVDAVRQAPGGTETADELAAAVRRVVAGHRVIDPQLALSAWDGADSPLTERETEVLRLVAQGWEPGEIAKELHLSAGTVRNYLTTVVSKLNARNRVDAIRIAQASDWLL